MKSINIKQIIEGVTAGLRAQNKKTLIIAGAGILLAVVAAVGYFIFLAPDQVQQKAAVVVPKPAKAGAKDNSTKGKGHFSDNKTDNKTADNKTSATPAKTAQAAAAPDNGTAAEHAAGKKGDYTYTASARRDPFIPLVILRTETEKKKGGSPFEDYEVSDFKLIAILWNKTAYYAMITLPDGKSYTIKTGAKLGINGGKVYKITNDSVIITEPARDYRGAIVQKEIILKLRKEEE